MKKWQFILAMLLAGCFTEATAEKSLLSSDAETKPRKEWLRGHGTDQGEHVFEGHQTHDDGFIAVGTTRERNGGKGDALLVKTDDRGKLQWQRIVGEKGTP